MLFMLNKEMAFVRQLRYSSLTVTQPIAEISIVNVYQPIRIGVMRLMLLRAAAGVHPIVRHLTRYYEREQCLFLHLLMFMNVPLLKTIS